MSTTEELIAEVTERRTWPTQTGDGPLIDRLADALEQTTRELKEAESTLAKVREYLHGHRAVLDSHTKFELGSILDESASRPAPAEPSELVHCDYCGDALPSVPSRAHVPTTPNLQRLGFDADKVVCPECVRAAHLRAAAPAPIEAGEREAREDLEAAIFAYAEADDHPQIGETANAVYERLDAYRDAIRRAPIEDAEPFSCSLSGHAGCRRELREGSWWEVHLPAPTEDAEPVAYEFRRKRDGAFMRILLTEVVVPEDGEAFDLTPLYRHPSAPIEVTDEALRRGIAAVLVANGVKPHDPRYYELLDSLTAALKEMS